MRSYPRKGNTRRIPLGKAVTSCLYTAKDILEERRFGVHWARHKPEKGCDRWQVRCDYDQFEVHLGHKENCTLREVDSIVIKGLKGWRPLVLDWVESILLDESQYYRCGIAPAEKCKCEMGTLGGRHLRNLHHRGR